MLSVQEIKKGVAEKAVELIQPGMTVGIGTGSTAYWLLLALGQKVKAGFKVRCVPTSRETARLAKSCASPG